MSILAEIFDKENSINLLENFTSINGAKHYGLEINEEKIKLTKTNKPIKFNDIIEFNGEKIVIFKPDFPVFWKVVK